MSMHRGRESVGGDSACRQFGHFHKYAPEKIEYPFERYKMESQRLLDVLDKRLAETEYLAGSSYTIADIAWFPWVSMHVPEGGVEKEGGRGTVRHRLFGRIIGSIDDVNMLLGSLPRHWIRSTRDTGH